MPLSPPTQHHLSSAQDQRTIESSRIPTASRNSPRAVSDVSPTVKYEPDDLDRAVDDEAIAAKEVSSLPVSLKQKC